MHQWSSVHGTYYNYTSKQIEASFDHSGASVQLNFGGFQVHISFPTSLLLLNL